MQLQNVKDIVRSSWKSHSVWKATKLTVITTNVKQFERDNQLLILSTLT